MTKEVQAIEKMANGFDPFSNVKTATNYDKMFNYTNRKSMTRKDEILNKAVEFVDKRYQDIGIKTTHEASVAACQDMAEWSDKTIIDKACEWLLDKVYGYIEENDKFSGGYTFDFNSFLSDFRKAMEE